MFGPPEDVESECNAHLYLGDDWGDNSCTIRCELPAGHEGLHQEIFERDNSPVTITWKYCERSERQRQQDLDDAEDDLHNYDEFYNNE